jgi:hypothetical protein
MHAVSRLVLAPHIRLARIYPAPRGFGFAHANGQTPYRARA